MTPPLVLKPAFEHMSRGLGLAQTEKEAHTLAAHLIDTLHQPVLVESFIPGRELAVSLLEGPNGLEVLPPLEWRLEHTGSASNLLTEAFKLGEPVGERQEAVPAELTPDLRDELETLSRLAFNALGLRDYARLDIRLSSGGTFFFLEANTTPSVEPLEAFPLSARWAGLDYPALIERMLRAALHRYGHRSNEERRRVDVELPTGRLEFEIPDGVHPPPESSIDLARLLDVKPSESVLDLGCGSGILSIAAAKLGARRVVATDLDPRSLRATAANAERNGVAERIEIRAGSWYEALGDGNGPASGKERFDVILATPPQTPSSSPFGPRYGGSDGTKHLFAILDGARTFLNPDEGRLWLLAISIANPSALWKRLEERFCEVSLVHETDRLFTPEEYENISKGLFKHFLALRSQGLSEFKEMGDGKYVFRNLFIRAKGCRPL
jgi:methylase of polypeptide subunit release factors